MGQGRDFFDAVGEGGDGVFGVGFVFDDGHAVETCFFQCAHEAGQIKVAGADDDVGPLSAAVEDEILVMDAEDFAFESFADPLDGIAVGADLHAPGGVEIDSDLGAAKFAEDVQDIGGAAEHVAAVAVNADADVEFLAEAGGGGNGIVKCAGREMRGNVFGAGGFGALEPFSFAGGVADESLDADGNHSDAGGSIDIEDAVE